MTVRETKYHVPVGVTAKILDGAAVVQMTPPGPAKTFGQYGEMFAANIQQELRRQEHLRRVDVIFDGYFPGSLKSDTRAKRGSGARLSVRPNTPIASNWRQFLCVSENKEELFHLASKLEDSVTEGKVIVATRAENVVCGSMLNTDCLGPSNHE